MKNYLLPAFCLALIFFFTAANSQRVCGTIFNEAEVLQTDKERYQRFLKLEKHIQFFKKSLSAGNDMGKLINQNSTIIIPVVVHIIHLSGEPAGVGRNLSFSQVQSQIDVLNEDFRRLNADAANTPSVFLGVAADVNIQFRLACLDPNGNITTGITRTASSASPFTSASNNIKYTATGGHDAWPTNKYLNIWVGNLEGDLLGYGQLPMDYATSPETDGVVVRTTAFGRVGNVVAPFDKGRTATHEVGHWLNLYHIWGSGTSCSDSDYCDDTPNQEDETDGCPAFPSPSCSNGGDMTMNYMDYTDDACMNIYTNDQRIRMRANFFTGGARESFINNYFRINTPATTVFCNSLILTLSNPTCLPVTWSVVSGSATISASADNQATINATGGGNIVIKVSAGGYEDEITLKGFDHAPDYYSRTGVHTTEGYSGWLQTQNCLKTYTFPGMYSGEVDMTDTYATSYSWTYVSKSPSSATVGIGPSTEPDVTVTVKPRLARGTFRLTTTNPCGSYSNDYTFVADGPCLYESRAAAVGTALTVSPNPTSGSAVLNLDTKEDVSIREIVILNKSERMVKRMIVDGKSRSQTINISELAPDVYIVRVFDGTKWHSQKLVKQ